MLSKPGKIILLLALLALAACNKHKPAPSLTTTVAAHILETGALTVTPTHPVNTLTETSLLYTATDTTIPYPPPGHRVVTPVPSSTRSPTQTPSQTPIPSPTRIRLPTDLPTKTPLPVHIIQLRMFDAHTGWAVDSNFNIQRTTNGIKTWKNTTPPVAAGFRCGTAAFLDVNTAIAGCDNIFLPNRTKYEITTWRTINGGKTWKSGEVVSTDINSWGVNNILMLDSERGWMYGSGQGSMYKAPVGFYSTQDGGMHWKQDYKTDLGEELILWDFYGGYAYQDHFGFASKTYGFFSNGNLYSSTDGGDTWAPFTLEPPPEYPELNCTSDCCQCKYLDTISAPRFISSQDGVLIQRVYTNTVYVGDELAYSFSIHQLPLPEAQYLYFTHDGGQTWTPRLSPARIGTVYFLDQKNGWFLGKSDIDPNTPTQLYRTGDGGETWSLLSADCPVPLGSHFQFADGQAGFAFDNYDTLTFYYNMDVRIWEAFTHAYLFYTQDGGRTWAKTVPQIVP